MLLFVDLGRESILNKDLLKFIEKSLCKFRDWISLRQKADWIKCILFFKGQVWSVGEKLPQHQLLSQWESELNDSGFLLMPSVRINLRC